VVELVDVLATSSDVVGTLVLWTSCCSCWSSSCAAGAGLPLVELLRSSSCSSTLVDVELDVTDELLLVLMTLVVLLVLVLTVAPGRVVEVVVVSAPSTSRATDVLDDVDELDVDVDELVLVEPELASTTVVERARRGCRCRAARAVLVVGTGPTTCWWTSSWDDARVDAALDVVEVVVDGPTTRRSSLVVEEACDVDVLPVDDVVEPRRRRGGAVVDEVEVPS
jgi:hypothetical protein